MAAGRQWEVADSRHILTVELAWFPDGLGMRKREKRVTMSFGLTAWSMELESLREGKLR